MTRDEVLAKLAELPDTADGIAKFLAERGVKGEQNDGCTCPIACYLDSGWRVSVSHACPPDTLVGRVEHTPALFWFIRNFDRGRYPELIA